jgi:hypothetical protein
MTVFQALKPLLHFTCCFLHYLYLKSIFMQHLICQLGTFVSQTPFVGLIVQLELNCNTGEKDQAESGWVASRSEGYFRFHISHHFINYLERVSVLFV